MASKFDFRGDLTRLGQHIAEHTGTFSVNLQYDILAHNIRVEWEYNNGLAGYRHIMMPPTNDPQGMELFINEVIYMISKFDIYGQYAHN